VNSIAAATVVVAATVVAGAVVVGAASVVVAAAIEVVVVLALEEESLPQPAMTDRPAAATATARNFVLIAAPIKIPRLG
jgi:hypothetical protein